MTFPAQGQKTSVGSCQRGCSHLLKVLVIRAHSDRKHHVLFDYGVARLTLDEGRTTTLLRA